MNKSFISGIHHVSILSTDAQRDLEFYSGILGLQLVKKTVNFDDPTAYHLYFGQRNGAPGGIVTFFPYPGLKQGRHGTGMLNTTSFSVPLKALDFWIRRLEYFKIPFKNPQERFGGEVFLYFEDDDGTGLEFVFTDKDHRKGVASKGISASQAIKGFYNVEIWEKGLHRSEPLLTQQLNHQLIAERGNRSRFAAVDQPGNYVDIVNTPDAPKGLRGSGTVHHLAFATADEDSLFSVREQIRNRGMEVTFIKDRKYFSSIYFESPGGVLFEIATLGPGFTVDEPAEKLGQNLMLPQQFEWNREDIEKQVGPLKIDGQSFERK